MTNGGDNSERRAERLLRPSEQNKSRNTSVEAARMAVKDMVVSALDAADAVGVTAHRMHPTPQ